jgi:flavodoxin
MNDKSAVIYYSMHGNTEFVARTISAAVDAVTIRIRLIHPLPTNFLSFVFGGFQAVYGIKPAIHPVDINLSSFSTIFLGTPVWASRCSSPIKSFLSQYPLKGKKVALFACCGDNPGKTFTIMKTSLGDCQVIDEKSFANPLAANKAETVAAIESWAKKCISI